MSQEEHERIGQRARRYRRAQGKTLDEIAGLAGITKGYLSLLERGERRWDSRSLVHSVAAALEVRNTDLTGQPYAAGTPQDKAAQSAMAAIHLALVQSSLEDGADVAPRPLAALEQESTLVLEWRRVCDYPNLGRVLPRLISELTQSTTTLAGAERKKALWLLLGILHGASSLARNYGFLADALLAADRGLQIGQLLDDPVATAYAHFPRTHALSADGAFRVAAASVTRGLDQLDGHREGYGLEVYGAVLLAASYAVGSTGNKAGANDLLTEATKVAAKTGEAGMKACMFGPTNVDLHRVSIAVELKEYGSAVDIAKKVDPRKTDSKERQASFYADYGRARAYMRGGDTDAIQLFATAEKIAPERTHANPLVRDAVIDMLDSAQRVAGGPQLRGLAHRLGVL